MRTSHQLPALPRRAVALVASAIALWLLAAAALAAPGDPVPSFGGDGALTTDFKNGSEAGTAVAVMDDGKILVAGTTGTGYALVRLLPDGSPDQSFGVGGAALTFDGLTETFRPTGMVVMPDGKVVMSGTSVLLADGITRAAVARHNANGAPDTSFGGDGMVVLDFGGSSSGDAVALDDSGKILAGGTRWSTPPNAALARLNPNGTLDTTFGTGGQAMLAAPSGASDIALRDDGKILFAGPNGSDFGAARLNDDGSFDAGFGTGGVATIDMGGIDFADAIAETDNGRIILGGWVGFASGGNLGLAGLDASGQNEPSFGTGGKTVTDLGASETISEMAIQADGKIAVTGFKDVFQADLLVARYTAGGTLDGSFGTGGTSTLGAGVYAHGDAIVQQGDGRLVMAGVIGSDLGVARYNTNGTLDTTFGGSFQAGAASAPGYTRIRLPGGSEDARAVAAQGDGRLVVAGTTGKDVALARYHIDGSPDVSFGAGGKVITDAGEYDEGADIVIQPDGKILVAGTTDQEDAFLLLRYDPDGSLDTSFGTGGKVVTPGTDEAAIGHAVALQPDGKILVGGRSGFFDMNFGLARYNADGSPDATFGGGAIVETDFDGSSANDEMFDLLVLSDGRILTAGGATKADGLNDFALARYNPSGSPDTTFSGDGKVTINFGGDDIAAEVFVLPDGRILAAGHSQADFSDADDSIALARLNDDGSLDATFDGDGKVKAELGDHATIQGAALQTDGKVVVAGTIGYSIAEDLLVARFGGAGELDPTFGDAGLFTRDFEGKADAGNAVTILPDTSIVAAGYATLHDTSSDFALVRIEGDEAPATPTPVPGTQRLWGDADCNNAVNSVDSLKVSRHVAALSVAQTEPCPDVGSTVEVTDAPEHKWGDVDCDNDVDSVDALKLLRFVAALPVAQTEPCPDVGTQVLVAD